MQTSALFGEKTSDFSKFMLCSHEQRGGGSNFLRFCGHLLRTASYCIVSVCDFVGEFVNSSTLKDKNS